MDSFYAAKLDEFAKGKISRRALLETLTVAATTTFATGATKAASDPALKVQLINHISYQCPDYKKARDWYSSMFGMQVTNDKGTNRANLAFGPEPDKGGNFIVAHNPGNNPPKPSEAVIDHICYTISNWDEGKVRAALKARGYDNPTGRDGSLHVYDPFDYDIQIANAVEENAFRR